MRKLFISFALLISTISIASAQVLGIHPRFEAGASLPKIESSLGNIDLHSNSNTGYRVGVAVELPILPFVLLQELLSVTIRSVAMEIETRSQILPDSSIRHWEQRFLMKV